MKKKTSSHSRLVAGVFDSLTRRTVVSIVVAANAIEINNWTRAWRESRSPKSQLEK